MLKYKLINKYKKADKLESKKQIQKGKVLENHVTNVTL